MKLYHRRTIDGLQLIAAERAMLDRVEEALSLIRDFDPLRYRRLLKDVERIWVNLLAGPVGQFNSITWTCELDRRFVLDEMTTPELIAAVIVHEATHARLHRRQIGYPEKLRQRIEYMCVRQEWIFSTKLPDGAEIRELAERSLAAPPSDLSDKALLLRREKDLREFFTFAGLPEWSADRFLGFAKWIRSLRAWKRRRSLSARKPS